MSVHETHKTKIDGKLVYYFLVGFLAIHFLVSIVFLFFSWSVHDDFTRYLKTWASISVPAILVSAILISLMWAEKSHKEWDKKTKDSVIVATVCVGLHVLVSIIVALTLVSTSYLNSGNKNVQKGILFVSTIVCAIAAVLLGISDKELLKV